MDVKNLRGMERFNLTEALGGSFGSASITILNISADGLKVEHAQPIRLGTKARLWFRRAEIAVSVQALLMWSHLSKTPNDKGKYLYNSGLRIDTLGNEFSLSLQAMLDQGIAVPDKESLDRKRQRLVERTRDRNASTMKVVKQETDISPDQVLLIQHAMERLRGNPEEALKWYNRAKYAISQGGAYVASEMRNREDILAVWEYLERSVDLSTIVRVFERGRTTE